MQHPNSLADLVLNSHKNIFNDIFACCRDLQINERRLVKNEFSFHNKQTK